MRDLQMIMDYFVAWWMLKHLTKHSHNIIIGSCRQFMGSLLHKQDKQFPILFSYFRISLMQEFLINDNRTMQRMNSLPAILLAKIIIQTIVKCTDFACFTFICFMPWLRQQLLIGRMKSRDKVEVPRLRCYFCVIVLTPPPPPPRPPF